MPPSVSSRFCSLLIVSSTTTPAIATAARAASAVRQQRSRLEQQHAGQQRQRQRQHPQQRRRGDVGGDMRGDRDQQARTTAARKIQRVEQPAGGGASWSAASPSTAAVAGERGTARRSRRSRDQETIRCRDQVPGGAARASARAALAEYNRRQNWPILEEVYRNTHGSCGRLKPNEPGLQQAQDRRRRA